MVSICMRDSILNTQTDVKCNKQLSAVMHYIRQNSDSYLHAMIPVDI